MRTITITGKKISTILYFLNDPKMLIITGDILAAGDWNEESGCYRMEVRSGRTVNRYYTDKLTAGVIKVIHKRKVLWTIARARARKRLGDWVWGNVNEYFQCMATLQQMQRLQY